jgi:hypothetical protein
VGNQDNVYAVDGVPFGIRGIPFNPRIDQNDFASGQAELVCAMTEPGDFYHF